MVQSGCEPLEFRAALFADFFCFADREERHCIFETDGVESAIGKGFVRLQTFVRFAAVSTAEQFMGLALGEENRQILRWCHSYRLCLCHLPTPEVPLSSLRPHESVGPGVKFWKWL